MKTSPLDKLVCPVCKGPLKHDPRAQELICENDKKAYPIRDGIPIMLPGEARSLSESGQPASK
ncbi:MAG: Trm112 family protein [Alcaligenaceae bacterium]|nr:Trm112 family protein [Alcaligenaceae bacterium]